MPKPSFIEVRGHRFAYKGRSVVPCHNRFVCLDCGRLEIVPFSRRYRPELSDFLHLLVPENKPCRFSK